MIVFSFIRYLYLTFMIWLTGSLVHLLGVFNELDEYSRSFRWAKKYFKYYTIFSFREYLYREQ